ncbi:MAG: UDP-N-acetylmuramoyl-L-alanyl-D-glutamate--2,6-diaminopimelate ligase [Actinomycetaceae bacterium]|nr:UDP-N-acetylmuramoyl-L-alanyl-D-glutamate--2,6-diaminopimelate ligase [Arcanobacterium sp.]MDD7504865.1 UDP-N-acetylmuramoyl-L-alanyl-D-glutamate--2,6-diaminopimelate ligase [Actinomycetaceae bacterium]MDY6142700.1 UDP-N-acetylmuramoyl-L-alanyl-D-glutamate--2,6-diaminopimelate ligase [Arcanobacterium sp.]
MASIIRNNLTIADYLAELRGADIVLNASVPDDAASSRVRFVTYDSRKARPGTLFIAKGSHFDPAYLDSARDAGAIAVIADESRAEQLAQANTQNFPVIVVSDIHQAIIATGHLYYGQVTDYLRTAGVTGTKGKSTVVYFMRSVLRAWLEASGAPGPAFLSSIKNYDGGAEEESHLTTPEPFEIYEHFANAYSAGIEHMVMEVSSQALKYGRVDGMTFTVGAFLNISEDHISPVEHADFDDYYTSKLKLFDHCKTAFVNADADLAERTIAHARERCRVLTFGSTSECDVYCAPESVTANGAGFDFHVESPWYSGDFHITMPGRFNVSNALAVIGMCGELGVPEEYVRSGLAGALVPGRMEVYSSADGDVVAVVDYAHNRLSYEKVFESLSAEYPGYDVVSVFGSAGGKALDRRIALPEVASRYSKLIYLTEDDNYYEPFNSIASDMLRNVTVQCIVNEDRAQCIHDAIVGYPGRHVVAILGKGAETTRARGGDYVEVPTDGEDAMRSLAEYDSLREGDR